MGWGRGCWVLAWTIAKCFLLSECDFNPNLKPIRLFSHCKIWDELFAAEDAICHFDPSFGLSVQRGLGRTQEVLGCFVPCGFFFFFRTVELHFGSACVLLNPDLGGLCTMLRAILVWIPPPHQIGRNSVYAVQMQDNWENAKREEEKKWLAQAFIYIHCF